MTVREKINASVVKNTQYKKTPIIIRLKLLL